MRISAGRRDGRSHRAQGTPCQDAFASWSDPAAERAAAAVADGLGSKPLSHFGSQAAADAAVASLAAEPEWDDAALTRAFEAARAAVQEAAAAQGVAATELATTLQIATLDGGKARGAMLGDGAVIAGKPDGPTVLLAPEQLGYANEVVPLTHSRWRDHLRVAAMDGATWAMLFTDGLTRLLLARSRQGWEPFAPFFEVFAPKLQGAAFDEGLVARFLDGPKVDASWDDDKCLVVLAAEPVPASQEVAAREPAGV